MGEKSNLRLVKTFIFSRHNIRGDLPEAAAILRFISPRNWTHSAEGTANLTAKGVKAELSMARYLKNYFCREGLFAEGAKPASGEIRIYANSLQRTTETARICADVLFGTAAPEVETHKNPGEMDPAFVADLAFHAENFAEEFLDWYEGLEGGKGLKAHIAAAERDLKNVERLLDYAHSARSKATGQNCFDSGKFGAHREGLKPAMNEELMLATLGADTVLMRYCDEPDDSAAAFGEPDAKDLLESAGRAYAFGVGMMWNNPYYAKTVAGLILPEIASELADESRKFTLFCGHDLNIWTILAAIGVTGYQLPETITPQVPMGTKLVIEKRTNAAGESYADAYLLYANDRQLRNLEDLNDESNPPMRFGIEIPGLSRKECGLYGWDELKNLFAETAKECVRVGGAVLG